MTFITPALLAGIGLIALPIVLHLIMRRKPKLLEFPALRFIQKRHETNQRQLRLRHLILLLLRAAAIALLATALARPSMKFGGALGSQEAPVAVAMVFDTAARMEYRQDNETRLEAAREIGQRLLAGLPPKSEIAVLDTRLGPAALQPDRGAAQDVIGRLETVANSQPLPDVLSTAAELLGRESDLPQKEIYVFTDLAQAAWPTAGAAVLQQRLEKEPNLGIYVVDVGVDKPTNFALGELRLSNQVLSNRGRLTLETDLSCVGTEGQRTVELHVWEDTEQNGGRLDEPQKRSDASYPITPEASQQVRFRLGGLPRGTHQGFVRIVGQDGLAADDARYFTVEVKPAWKILLAAPEPAGQRALFLREALSPTMLRQLGRVRYECDVIDLAKLPEQSLEGYSAVCLLDPTPLEPGVWKKLGDCASDGRGVGIFLGRNARPVDSFNAELAQTLLPGMLLRQARAPEGVYLAPRSLEHPVLRAFRDMAGSIPWDFHPVFRYWELKEPQGTILSYSDGRPAVLERTVGSGRAVTMTTPVSDAPDRNAWNLLPVGEAWPFVILANQMTSYLVGSGDQRLNYFAEQRAVLPLDDTEERSKYQLTTPGGMKFPVIADQKRSLVEVTSTGEVGNYRLQAGGQAGVDRGFSVNFGPEQTLLQRADKEQLAAVFGPLPFRVARDSQQLEGIQREGRVGRELFATLILLVVLVLAAEHVMANRFYRD